jgi:hypothetical protein
MPVARPSLLPRRRFLQLAGGLMAGSAVPLRLWADGRPAVINPRATSGDSRAEPDWQQRFTLSVGPENADLVGSNDRVIQAAVDYVARLGGGTVKLMPGTYRLRNAVYLRSGIRVVGSGLDSVLLKEPSHTTQLVANSDWYDQEITLADSDGFQVGDGVTLRAKNPHDGGDEVVKRTLVARSGNRFKLDRAPRTNFWLSGEPTASTLFPIFSGEEIADVVIENVALDGNKENNEELDGNYAGCIFLQDCNRITMRGVTARNYNGDGISWQICHDVVVEDCHSHDHTGLGLHPGSGSQRPLMRNNRLERNDIGVFFCWGVMYGLAERNRIVGNRLGVSIGHRDTDNVVRDNDILESGEVGVLFRTDEREKDFEPDRNRIENNRIVNSGPDDGVGIDVRGRTDSITLVKNELRETRQPMRRIGVRLGPQVGTVTLADNHVQGFATDVADLRGSAG